MRTSYTVNLSVHLLQPGIEPSLCVMEISDFHRTWSGVELLVFCGQISYRRVKRFSPDVGVKRGYTV